MNTVTQYLGLDLRNPIVVGASPLTLDADSVRKCADAGAGAVVLKSLFEEQIRNENSSLSESLANEGTWHSEVFEYMEADIGMRYGTRDYLNIIRTAKEAADIPVIASINCISPQWWQDFARETEAAGADALELNIALMPGLFGDGPRAIEEKYERIVREAREAVSLPLAVKLPPYFTSIPHMALRLRQAGVEGLVLLNRLYRPTIDIENLTVVTADEDRYSTHPELSPVLRWIAHLAERVDVDLAATTGVHSGEDVIRVLLAGGKVAQTVTAPLSQGLEVLGRMTDTLGEWMERHKFESIADFRGRLCQERNPDNELFGRVQYIKGLVGLE